MICLIALKYFYCMNLRSFCNTKLLFQSGPDTFIDDINRILMPFLRRYQNLQGTDDAGDIMYEYLEMISEEDLCPILLVRTECLSFRARDLHKRHSIRGNETLSYVT